MGIGAIGNRLYGATPEAKIKPGSQLETYAKNQEKLDAANYDNEHRLRKLAYGLGTGVLGLAILGAASPETAKGLLEGAGDWIQERNIGSIFGQSVEEVEVYATEAAAEAGGVSRTMFTGAEEGFVQELFDGAASIFDQPVFQNTEGRLLVGGGATLVGAPAFVKWNKEQKQRTFDKGDTVLK